MSSQHSAISGQPIRNPQSEIRNLLVQVGDQIQYEYLHGRDTRRVIEVIDAGAAFVVEGGYNVFAYQITVHLPAGPDPTYCLNCEGFVAGVVYCQNCGDPLVHGKEEGAECKESGTGVPPVGGAEHGQDAHATSQQHPVLGRNAAAHGGYTWCRTRS